MSLCRLASLRGYGSHRTSFDLGIGEGDQALNRDTFRLLTLISPYS